MTRKKEIDKIASAFAIDEVKDTCNPASKRGLLYVGFVTGAEWADAHPHWISVEDELPKEYEEVLAIANVDGNIVPFVGVCENGMFYFTEPTIRKERRVTHWMPLPSPPTCSEKPNNCEKGGNQ